MNVLVIGGSGHVSGTVARTALAAGHDVWAITRGTRPLPEGVTALTVDRHDNEAMAAAVAGQEIVWDLVVDCICFDLPDIRQDIELFSDRATQFVFVSTDFVYDPFLRNFPQPEESNHFVTSKDDSQAYGFKKRLCELELIEGDADRLNWTIVRPCHIYGPTSELGCLPLHGRDPKLIESLRAGAPIQLVGGGHFLQQPILVSDLAETILSIAGNRNAIGRVFNVAGPDVVESWKYYQIVADTLGVELKVEEIPVQSHLTDHPKHAPFLCHRIYDIDAIGEAGLSIPSTTIEDGLRRHVEGLLKKARSSV